MNLHLTVVGAVALAVLACVGLLARGAVFGPVARSRVERFCRHQSLVLTAANGAAVLSYLAVTRRWRTLGLVVALVGYMAWELHRSALGVSLLDLLIGWFVGAIVAEWRIDSRITGQRRSAALIRRQARAYVNVTALTIMWSIVVVVVLGCLAVAYAGRTDDGDGGSSPAGNALLLAAMVVTGFVIVLRAQQRVLTRPRTTGPADVVAADDAVRSRSLHVLTGAAVALAIYAAAFAWGFYNEVHAGAGAGVELALSLAGPLIGARIATWPFQVAQPVPSPAPVDAV